MARRSETADPFIVDNFNSPFPGGEPPRQAVRARVPRGTAVSFDVRFQNDGDYLPARYHHAIPGGNANFVVELDRPGRDIVRGPTGFLRTYAEGETYDVRVTVKVRRRAAPGTKLRLVIDTIEVSSAAVFDWGNKQALVVTSLCNPALDSSTCTPAT